MRSLLLAGVCVGASALSSGVLRTPTRSAVGSVQMSAVETPTSRRAAVGLGLATLAGGAIPAKANDAPGYQLKKDYPADARQMLDNMKVATELTRGAPDMEKIVTATRTEMNDFVAFYRRQPKVAGMPSFSTMYTAINTLSGHYASYGNKYPVPEKRRVRLQQQYKEIGACRHT
jgi:photosystem II Psb27 protein